MPLLAHSLAALSGKLTSRLSNLLSGFGSCSAERHWRVARGQGIYSLGLRPALPQLVAAAFSIKDYRSGQAAPLSQLMLSCPYTFRSRNDNGFQMLQDPGILPSLVGSLHRAQAFINSLSLSPPQRPPSWSHLFPAGRDVMSNTTNGRHTFLASVHVLAETQEAAHLSKVPQLRVLKPGMSP